MNPFTAIGVLPEIAAVLTELGYTAPTPIQEKVIPALLTGDGDRICLAQTGTGKTAAFGIPLVQLVDVQNRQPQAMVLCPTRELCLQVATDLSRFGRKLRGLKVQPVYGGAPMGQQRDGLRRGAQIVVATPGRLRDLLDRGAVSFAMISRVVLDEADEMLQMGFLDEITSILKAIPVARQTLLFSATMSPVVRKVAGRYMQEPSEILIGPRNGGVDTIRHQFCVIASHNRYAALQRLIVSRTDMYGIVFCRTKNDARTTAEALVGDGLRAKALHGDLSQSQREEVMRRFRARSVRILVATDVAARGVDIADLNHVIHYNLPTDTASYNHRSGRTGRAGRQGVSIALILGHERNRIRNLERSLGRTFEQQQVPTGRDICDQRIHALLDTLRDMETPDHLAPYLDTISAKLAGLDREELVRRLLALQFKDVLETYGKAPDLNKVGSTGPRKGQRAGTQRSPGRGTGTRFTGFKINIGARHGMNPQRLIGMFNANRETRNIDIGRIKVRGDSAMVEADSRFADVIVTTLSGQIVEGKKIQVTISTDSRGRNVPSRAGGKKQGTVVRRRRVASS